MKKFGIVFGVCGIGRGHIFEMLPIIENYVRLSHVKVAIFSFGESYRYFSKRYNKQKNVLVLEVAIPWIHGSLSGIDYAMSAKDEQNRKDYVSKNFGAMDKAKKFMGKPCVVATDYEPVSAAYAYSMGVKLITIDQQSKYLLPGFPNNIGGFSPLEERSRLKMFIPYADIRIINSFFKITATLKDLGQEKLLFYGPIIREDIISIKNQICADFSNVLVYLSPYSPFVQEPTEVMKNFKQMKSLKFYIFTSQYSEYENLKRKFKVDNVYISGYNDKKFIETLKKCRSVITSSGHTLLSELMYLGKPVLVVPLNTFEQHYSARIINDAHCGVAVKRLNVRNIRNFINSIGKYEQSIKANKSSILYREPAQFKIIKTINSILEK